RRLILAWIGAMLSRTCVLSHASPLALRPARRPPEAPLAGAAEPIRAFSIAMIVSRFKRNGPRGGQAPNRQKMQTTHHIRVSGMAHEIRYTLSSVNLVSPGLRDAAADFPHDHPFVHEYPKRK